MPLASNLAHLAWGVAAMRAGKRKIAARELVLAKKMSDILGARAYTFLAERSFEQLGNGHLNSSIVGRNLLTPKEDAVVELATSGYSNAEIAKRLVVNIKTVEYRLRRVYAKLGIASRRDLAL